MEAKPSLEELGKFNQFCFYFLSLGLVNLFAILTRLELVGHHKTEQVFVNLCGYITSHCLLCTDVMDVGKS